MLQKSQKKALRFSKEVLVKYLLSYLLSSRYCFQGACSPVGEKGKQLNECHLKERIGYHGKGGEINKGFPVEMTSPLAAKGYVSYPDKRVEVTRVLSRRNCTFNGLKVTTWHIRRI